MKQLLYKLQYICLRRHFSAILWLTTIICTRDGILLIVFYKKLAITETSLVGESTLQYRVHVFDNTDVTCTNARSKMLRACSIDHPISGLI